MKNLLKIMITIYLIFISFTSVIALESDVYDVILFWGQSNMTGYAGFFSSTPTSIGEDKYDSRITKIGIKKFSEITGIKKEFFINSTAINHVNINQINNTVYEYKYSTDSLDEISLATVTFGESLKYENNNLINIPTENYRSLQQSYGTNLISQFSKTYYQLTNHKVIIVMASNGGEEIAHFLPHNEVQLYSKTKVEQLKQQYIYEAMVIKYKAALNYLEKNNLKIGNKLYVVMQGESDVIYAQKGIRDYEKIFQNVHNHLKADLGIQLGVIIETAHINGKPTNKGVELIHQSQENLIKKNKDIILGTSYAYNHYVPSKQEYKGLNYSMALYNANLSTCITEVADNRAHYTSAALSQIGHESAISVANYLNTKNNESQTINQKKENVIIIISLIVLLILIIIYLNTKSKKSIIRIR